MIGPMVTPFRSDSTLRVCRWQEFRERLTDRLRHRGIAGPEPGQWVGRLEVQLHAAPDGARVHRAGRRGIAGAIPLEPRRQRPPGLAARWRALALERQPGDRA